MQLDNIRAIHKLITQREQSTLHTEQQQITQQIIQALQDQYGSQLNDERSKHVILHQLRLESDAKEKELRAKEVIRPTRTLRPENQRRELTDTTLMGYLQLLLVPDPSDYRIRNSENRKTWSDEEFVSYQNERIDATPIDYSMLTDREMVDLFGMLTDHQYSDQENIRHYRNQAAQYIPQLKESLKLAQPHTRPNGSTSYKILTMPDGQVLEFVYRYHLNRQRREDLMMGIRTYPSLDKCLNDHAESATTMRGIAKRLERLKDDFQSYDPSLATVESLVDQIQAIYDNKYTQKSHERFTRAELHKEKMHKNQYHLMIQAILDDIDKSIHQLNAMADRYDAYGSTKR